ncbi:bifunctional diguanylate cyclase/phosphodiesterase [Pseudomonas sp. RIT-PI-S]|uniref:putative bifunctional diguanylate cyclase/phosphodiesterase n=1 Tax=Pseudomonas sp. RIT-PI-S TaxID=3035295 RepID=UPI0021D92111|nr:bifunctional diguanylate cyclase/phosphodiesterase [Pseudomonas sp. RIT-PI-S]
MTDFHRSHPYRLVQLLLLTLLTMGGLSILWEFKLEAWSMHWLGLPYDGNFENGERWRFVVTSIGFSLLSLILPTVLLKRLVNNTRSSYRRMQREQSKTETLARYDSLSGLINRRVFMEMLRTGLKQAEPMVIMLIDLDRFKAINDKYGHCAGDSVLIEVASRLSKIAFEHSGIAARLGGDEFCLLLMDYREEAALRNIAESIIASLSRPVLETLEPSSLGATIGISRSWVDAVDASALLHYADTAMYRGKNSGRSTYYFHDIEYERQRRAQFDLDFALKQAIEREEIVPFFQPIVALPSQAVVGFEILARWVKPDGGTGMPSDFIPVLERLGLIPAMTRSLVRQACLATKEWDAHLHLSLNVSAAMITDELFPDRLLEQLRQEQFPFDRFEVEITEEALVGNLEAAQRNLSRLHAHGITVALDDFGIGYSGLYHLTRLSIDKIKIDRSFFEAGNVDHLPMVEAILGMARSLKMKVTAEGIEQVHLPHLPSWLASNGCHFAQGYLYGRPQTGFDTALNLQGQPRLKRVVAFE